MSATSTFMVIALSLPLALALWVAYVMGVHALSNNPELDQIPPTRWLIATLLPIFVMVWGLRRKSLSGSGASAGAVIGFILTLGNFCFVSDLLMFFFTSSKLTKFRSAKKRLLEEEFKEGGQRNWAQVLCNGGMGALLAVLYITDVGCGEVPVNFSNYYRATWLSLGVMGAFACGNGDTWASEVGSVIGGVPILITTGQKVPRGTNGGITFGGVLCSFLGGAVVGLAHFLTVLYFVDEALLRNSGPQWPVILVGGFAGLFGSFLDSLMGATLQYSGVHKKKGCIVQKPGKNIVHVSGYEVLDNHSVNLISTIAAGILTPMLTNMVWH